MARPRLVAIIGPTGAGKSRAAVELAETAPGCVVNFDSRQVYAGLETVTAQPTPREQAGAAHRLYGFLDPCSSISAGEFRNLAAQTVVDVLEQGKLPILTGGTGLYLDAFLYGLAPMPAIPPRVRDELQACLKAQGSRHLYDELARVDPEYAARIHPNDGQRVTRALEVHRASGRPFSSWHRKQDKSEPFFDCLKLGVFQEIDDLKPRLAARIEAMLEHGALEEVRAVLDRCPDAHSLSGIGCAELAAHLQGETTLSQARDRWLASTRAYAKRQMTWFGRDRDIVWFPPGSERDMAEAALAWLGR
jgi:tRNA dimethylallyltransferase